MYQLLMHNCNHDVIEITSNYSIIQFCNNRAITITNVFLNFTLYHNEVITVNYNVHKYLHNYIRQQNPCHLSSDYLIVLNN